MNSDSNSEKYLRTAMRAIQGEAPPSSKEELEFDVDAAIAGNDLFKIWQMIPRLAALDGLTLTVIKTKLHQKFKRDFSPREFERHIKEHQKKQKKAGRGMVPGITVTDRRVPDVSEDTLAALRVANEPPELFMRSGDMVHVVRDERERPSIERVDEAYFRGCMARAVDYFKVTLQGGEIHIPPPIEVVRDVMSRSEDWGFPPLTSLVEIPTLRPDGTILDTPGYDPQSHMIYAPAAGLETLPVPESPTVDDVDGAVALLDDTIGEFPYADQASRANTFGLLLTPIVRPALQGCCTPLALIDAPRAGTGKSLLVDVFSTITTGRPGAMMPYPEKEEEMQKQVFSSLIAGRPLICFDNLEGILQSPCLALAITAKDYESRVLGVSENMVVPNNATWVVTGNNIRPSGDMPRRCYQIRLDAKMSNPFRGRTFRHSDLLAWVSENRARLLHALLVIARYWFAAGQPVKIADPLGSFEAWHRTVGSILAYAGVEGFLGNLDEFMVQADETALQWEGFLLALADQYPKGSAFTVSELAEQAAKSDRLRHSLPDTLSMALEKKSGGFQRSLGNAFSKRREMRFGETGAHLVRGSISRTRAVYWKVIIPGLSEDQDDLILSMN
jgi:hypothetical protein